MFNLVTSRTNQKLKEEGVLKPLGLAFLYYAVIIVVQTLMTYSIMLSFKNGEASPGASYYAILLINYIITPMLFYYVLFHFLKYSKDSGKAFIPEKPTKYLKFLLLFLLMNIKILLWSLLLVVPGIIKTFEYAMVPYIFVENPDMGINDIFAKSKRIMDGYKGELFSVNFILGIIFIIPYILWMLLVIPSAMSSSNLLAMTDISFLEFFMTTYSQTFIQIIPVIIFFAYSSICVAMFYNEISSYGDQSLEKEWWKNLEKFIWMVDSI